MCCPDRNPRRTGSGDPTPTGGWSYCQAIVSALAALLVAAVPTPSRALDTLVNTTVEGDQHFITRAAFAPDGTFLAIWSGAPGGLGVQRFDFQGRKLGPEVGISAGWSDIAVLPDGRVLIVGVAYDDTPDGWIGYVRLSPFTYDLRPDGDPIRVNVDHSAGMSSNPRIVVASDGRVLIYWEGQFPAPTPEHPLHTRQRGYFRFFDNQLSPIGPQKMVFAEDRTSDFLGDVDFLSGGGFVVAAAGAEGNYERAPLAAIMDSEGNLVRVISLAPRGGPEARAKYAASGLSDGGFALAWSHYYTRDGSAVNSAIEQDLLRECRTRVFDADGTPRGPEMPVHPNEPGVGMEPVIAAAPDGTYAVLCEVGSSHDSGADRSAGIALSRFTNLGVQITSASFLNSYTIGHQMSPGVAVAPSGDFFALWSSRVSAMTRPSAEPPGGDREGVLGRLIRFGPKSCPSVPQPQEECTTGFQSQLLMSKTDGGVGDGLRWIFEGTTESAMDFGNPALGYSGYALCVYDSSTPDAALVWSASIPASIARNASGGWRERRGRNSLLYAYRGSGVATQGLRNATLRAPGQGGNRIDISGHGRDLELPELEDLAGPLRVQFLSSEGRCWDATYDATVDPSGHLLAGATGP